MSPRQISLLACTLSVCVVYHVAAEAPWRMSKGEVMHANLSQVP